MSNQEVDIEGDANRSYKYWSIRIFYSLYIGYTFYYFCRTGFNVLKTMIASELNFTNSDLGSITTWFAIAYGTSKFVSGMLSDRSQSRYFMAIGLMISAILNIVFSNATSLLGLCIIWGLNGWFQGFGWPPIAKLLTHWYPKSSRGRWWSLTNTSQNLGGSLAPLFILSFVHLFEKFDFSNPWRYGLATMGGLSMLISFFLVNRLRDDPESVGLPSIKEDVLSEEITVQKELVKTPFYEVLFKHIFSNGYLWLLAASSLLVYIIRAGVTEWLPRYLKTVMCCSDVLSASSLTCFELGGFIGMLTAGFVSDKFFKGKRTLTNVIFSTGVVVALFALSIVSKTDSAPPLLYNILAGTTGFFIFGPQLLLGVTAAELVSKKFAGTSTGFLAVFAYAGVAMVGFPMGLLIDKYNWIAFFTTLVVCGALNCAILSLFYILRKKSIQREV